MKIRVPDYYKEFKCIAERCTDTCCAGWQVDVDDASYAYYKTIKGSFGDRLKSVMVDGKKGAEGQFRIRPDGRCPFLNDNNLCDLYAELGEEALCVTCDQYPRYHCEFGNVRETGIALSCITAAELILKDNRTPGFDEYEDENSFPSINNIDAELYFALVKARDKAYSIIWDRNYNIWDRMTLLMYFSLDLQKKIKKPAGIAEVIALYTKEYMDKCLDAVHREKSDTTDIIENYKGIFFTYLKQVIIKKEWPEMIDRLYENMYYGDFAGILKEFTKEYADKEYELENIITYFVYRYFLKAVFDRDVLTKVKMGVISTLVIYQCLASEWYRKGKKLDYDDRVHVAHLYSREVEHSEENFESLCKAFAKKRRFLPKNLVRLMQFNNR